MDNIIRKPLLLDEGSPLYSSFEIGMLFFLVRFSSSAYSSSATFRAAMPVVCPGYSILHRADHIVSVASLVTCAWKVRILLTGSPRRNIPWSNCLGNHPWFVRMVPWTGSTLGLFPIKWSTSSAQTPSSFIPGDRCISPGRPGRTLPSVHLRWIFLVRICVSLQRADRGVFFSRSYHCGLSAEVRIVGGCVFLLTVRAV